MKKEQFWKALTSGEFASMIGESSKGQALLSALEVYNVMKPLFAENDDVEMIYCIFLDAKNTIIAIEKIFSGSLTASAVYPREIVKRLIALKASAFVMVHNHPSGDPSPSAEDLAFTRRLAEAGEIVGVRLVDHLILGGPGRWTSLRQRGAW